MTWRAANSLLTLHEQLKRGAPRAAPPATSVDEWGLVGDLAHTSTSDHTPHDFPGWGTQIVTAADFPNRPDLGLDAHQVLDDIRRAHDPRAKYGISNGQIFSNHDVTQGGAFYPAWTWRPYRYSDGSLPSDLHETHGHLSVVGNQISDSTATWPTIGGTMAAAEGDDDMGASFGPIELNPGTTSLCIPPVQGGVADPRKVWLNVGADTFGADYELRIFASNGDGRFFALNVDGKHADGVYVLQSGVVLSVQLPAGLRLLSITRQAIAPADGTPQAGTGQPPAAPAVFAGSISVCFERQ